MQLVKRIVEKERMPVAFVEDHSGPTTKRIEVHFRARERPKVASAVAELIEKGVTFSAVHHQSENLLKATISTTDPARFEDMRNVLAYLEGKREKKPA